MRSHEVGFAIRPDWGRAKTVSELYAPVSGKVVEVNEELSDSPEFVNESPYEKAWMVVVEPTDTGEVDKLMTAEEYDKMINEG